MAMTKEEGLKVIKFVKEAFNIEFSKDKGYIWLEILMERGDYEKTMRNVKDRASDGNKFRPTISEIVIKPVKNNNFKTEYDETKSHAYKKRNDEQYAQVIKKLEGLRNKLYKEVEQNEE